MKRYKNVDNIEPLFVVTQHYATSSNL